MSVKLSAAQIAAIVKDNRIVLERELKRGTWSESRIREVRERMERIKAWTPIPIPEP